MLEVKGRERGRLLPTSTCNATSLVLLLGQCQARGLLVDTSELNPVVTKTVKFYIAFFSKAEYHKFILGDGLELKLYKSPESFKKKKERLLIVRGSSSSRSRRDDTLRHVPVRSPTRNLPRIEDGAMSRRSGVAYHGYRWTFDVESKTYRVCNENCFYLTVAEFSKIKKIVAVWG